MFNKYQWAETMGAALCLKRFSNGDVSAPRVSPWLLKRIKEVDCDLTPFDQPYSLICLGARYTLMAHMPDEALATMTETHKEQLLVMLSEFCTEHVRKYVNAGRKRPKKATPSTHHVGKKTAAIIYADLVKADAVGSLYLPIEELTSLDPKVALALSAKPDYIYMMTQRGDCTFTEFFDLLQLKAFAEEQALIYPIMKAMQSGLSRRGIPAINRAVYRLSLFREIAARLRSPKQRKFALNTLDKLTDYNL
jgi:hypothetical protein